MRRKKILLMLALLCAICGLSVLSACAANDDNAVENRDLLDEIRERGYVVVGTTGDYRPLSWLNPETEQYEGLDADLSAIIAEELGVELRWYHTSWPTINTDALDPSKFDMANCGITITDKRLETLAMSEPYLDNGKTILCRVEDAARFAPLISQPFTHGHIGILMRQDCPRLLEEVNAIIGRMKRDGRLDQLKEKYL